MSAAMNFIGDMSTIEEAPCSIVLQVSYTLNDANAIGSCLKTSMWADEGFTIKDDMKKWIGRVEIDKLTHYSVSKNGISITEGKFLVTRL